MNRRYAIAICSLTATLSGAAVPKTIPTPSVEQSVATASYAAGRVRSAPLEATPLAPGAKGDAKFAVAEGSIEIALSVSGLPPAADAGPGFLTYTVWAVTTEGRTLPLGELFVARGRGKLGATTPFASFGLIVTAEPHFATAAPSEAVVLRTIGDAAMTAPYRAMARSAYANAAEPAVRPGVPVEWLQAENALRLAREHGAEELAPDPFARAAHELDQARAVFATDPRSPVVAAAARDATQAAAAADAIAAERFVQLQHEAQLAACAAREGDAKAAAEEARAAADEARWKTSETEAREANEIRRREQAEQTAARAESEKRALRGRLLEQLNLVLDTRDSARGLIVNLGDVLFDVGRYTLRPTAREKLAKLSGLVLANSGLRLEVEGHTDSTGNDALNQTLSDNRAAAVRDYLVEQKVSEEAISSRGFGESQPAASNDTAEGRQQNRRVEIIVSGESIGTRATEEPQP